jgi:hypothetical protein
MAYDLTEAVLYTFFPTILALLVFLMVRYACCGRESVDPTEDPPHQVVHEDPQAIAIPMDPIPPVVTTPGAPGENPSNPV